MIQGYTFLLDAEERSMIKSRRLVLKEISQKDEERVFDFPLKDVQRGDSGLLLFIIERSSASSRKV